MAPKITRLRHTAPRGGAISTAAIKAHLAAMFDNDTPTPAANPTHDTPLQMPREDATAPPARYS